MSAPGFGDVSLKMRQITLVLKTCEGGGCSSHIRQEVQQRSNRKGPSYFPQGHARPIDQLTFFFPGTPTIYLLLLTNAIILCLHHRMKPYFMSQHPKSRLCRCPPRYAQTDAPLVFQLGLRLIRW